MPRLSVPRRQRTIHSRLREYIAEVLSDKEFQSSLLPIGDGILLSVKKENTYEKA